MSAKFNIFFPIDETNTEESNLDAFKSILDDNGLVLANNMTHAVMLNTLTGNPKNGVLKITVSAEIVIEATK